MRMRLTQFAQRFLADEDGAYIVEFAITFPVLILLSFGLLEFSLVVFDYQRAAEATRAGVRHTIINEPIANIAGVTFNDTIITCTNTTGTVVCVNGSPGTTADARFQSLLDEMQGIYPTLTAENIVVTYSGTDVGNDDENGGIFPLVTLQLTGVKHDMIVGHLIGIETIEFPAFTTTVLGPGNYTNVVEKCKGKGC